MARCDQCEKSIGERKLAYFSDPEKDLDFCSENCYIEWDKEVSRWKEIHPNFNYKFAKKWKDNYFSYKQVKEWKSSLKTCFEITDYNFYVWLRDRKHLTAETLNYEDIKELKEEYKKATWGDIHQHFGEYGRYYKEQWQKQGFDYQTTKEWIMVGFSPGDDYAAKHWLDLGFTPQETKLWITPA